MICPNCGKNVAQDTELCQYCNSPTQFSSKMKYYPRSTPLNAYSSTQKDLVKHMQVQQPLSLHGS